MNAIFIKPNAQGRVGQNYSTLGLPVAIVIIAIGVSALGG
jgi:hypothetical protein